MRLECVLHYVHPQQLVKKAHEVEPRVLFLLAAAGQVDKAPAGSCRVLTRRVHGFMLTVLQ